MTCVRRSYRWKVEVVHFEFSREGSAEGEMPGVHVELSTKQRRGHYYSFYNENTTAIEQSKGTYQMIKCISQMLCIKLLFIYN